MIFPALTRSAFAFALACGTAATLFLAPGQALAAEAAPVRCASGASLSLIADATHVLASSAERTCSEQDARRAAAHAENCTLPYDCALIEAVGSQAADGHWICCPAYACAYGDAVLTGEARSHTAYGCGCCTWPGWGGGNSSFRSLGSDDALLREAYDEIAAGRPTVVHVAGAYNEHWICLVGYQNVEDPDNLTLENFVAIDPVYGQLITASDGYRLYGDACEHITDAR